METSEGCNLALKFGMKFTETSPGLGHHTDELLVGIVMQLRILDISKPSDKPKKFRERFNKLFNFINNKEEEKRKLCINLNV